MEEKKRLEINLLPFLQSNMDVRYIKALKCAEQQIKASPILKCMSELYLYGSLARNEANWDSDIDLLIVLNENEKNNTGLKREIIRLKGNVSGEELDDPEVDLKFVFGDSWKRSERFFYKTIVKDGKLLWKRN